MDATDDSGDVSIDTSSDDGASPQVSDASSGPLDSIWNSVATAVANNAPSLVASVTGRATSSINNAPQPSLTAAAAQISTSTVKGVSVPILLIGAGALIYILMRRG